jgi:hypothetical protein
LRPLFYAAFSGASSFKKILIGVATLRDSAMHGQSNNEEKEAWKRALAERGGLLMSIRLVQNFAHFARKKVLPYRDWQWRQAYLLHSYRNWKPAA